MGKVRFEAALIVRVNDISAKTYATFASTVLGREVTRSDTKKRMNQRVVAKHRPRARHRQVGFGFGRRSCCGAQCQNLLHALTLLASQSPGDILNSVESSEKGSS